MKIICLGCAVASVLFAAGVAQAQTPPDPRTALLQESYDRNAKAEAKLSAVQPSSTSALPLTEAILIGSDEGGVATARVGWQAKFDDAARDVFAFDARLSNKPPDAGLPMLSSLDGLSDGAELSVGFARTRKPSIEIDGPRFLAACEGYYEKFPQKQPAGYVRGACTVDAANEDDAGLLSVLAPHIKKSWAYSLQARAAFSRPSFEFRDTIDADAESRSRRQHAYTFAVGALVPPNLAAPGFRDLLASWFITVEGSVGKDWDVQAPRTLCASVTAATLECEDVSIGPPFRQSVTTVTVSARRYLTGWLAVAPAWSRRWSNRDDGVASAADGRWSLDLPVFFLRDPDGGGLTGGVAASWLRGGVRRYVVFVGAALKPFEF